MRQFNEVMHDIVASRGIREKAGYELDATEGLRKDVNDFLYYASTDMAASHRDLCDMARQVLGKRLAIADSNFDEERMERLVRTTDLGYGELIQRSANAYSYELSDVANRDVIMHKIDSMCEELEQRGKSEADLIHEAEEAMLEEARQELESQMPEDYAMVLSQHGFPEDTPYAELPAFVTEQLGSYGIYNDDFLHENEDILPDKPLHDTMEEDWKEVESRSSIPGRIYGDGSSGRIYGQDGYDTSQNGSLVDEYGENQDNGYNYDDDLDF